MIREDLVAPWQVFVLVFVAVLPFTLVLFREPWRDDRLTFRGRPTERDWRRQLEPVTPDDH